MSSNPSAIKDSRVEGLMHIKSGGRGSLVVIWSRNNGRSIAGLSSGVTYDPLCRGGEFMLNLLRLHVLIPSVSVVDRRRGVS
ncbi:hypothetical protein TNCV_3644851 [Trichonephila clavipes]|nr:hypothetical protein TNCV_3644851 [Trichonephila clavipes]